MQKPFQVCPESYFMEELQRTPVLAAQSSVRKIQKEKGRPKILTKASLLRMTFFSSIVFFIYSVSQLYFNYNFVLVLTQ